MRKEAAAHPEKCPPGWPEDLRAGVRSGPLALFVGSGVSRDGPSFLPTGDELRDALFDAVVSQGEVPADLLHAARAIARRCRPESFLYILEEWQGTDWKTSLRFMLDVPPNANHRVIARIAATGKVRAILTTNFDCLLEKAMEGEVRFRQILHDDDFRTFASDASPVHVFKLHGSLVDAKGEPTQETILASLIELADRVTPGFSREKAQVLDQMLRSHVFVFVGYSGRDELDIQPFIERAPARQIIWVSHTDDSEEFRVVRSADIDRKKPLDPPSKLMRAHPDMIRVYANTRMFLSSLCDCLVGELPTDQDSEGEGEAEESACRTPALLIEKSPFSFLALAFRMAREWQHGAEAAELALSDMVYAKKAPAHVVAESHRNRGVCLKELGHFEAARADFQRALGLCERAYLGIYQELTDTRIHQAHFSMMSQICEDLALTDLAADELDRADEWINKAVWWSKRLVYPRQITFVTRNLANGSLIAKEKFLKTGLSSDLEEALQLAAASTASAASGSLVELVRSLNNWAWLLLEIKHWEEALSKAIEALSLAQITQGPHAKSEIKNLLVVVVVALCGLTSDEEAAADWLQRVLRENAHPLDASTVHTCLELFGKARRQGLCFAKNPEAALICLEGVLDLVRGSR